MSQAVVLLLSSLTAQQVGGGAPREAGAAGGGVPLPALGVHPRERVCIASLRSYRVLDSLPYAAVDAVTAAAARALGMPIASVTLVDADRQ